MTFALCAAAPTARLPLSTFLLLLAVGATPGCRQGRSKAQLPDVAPEKSAAPPSETPVTVEGRDGGDSRRQAAEVPPRLTIVEWAEADVIRVKDLNAIAIEANEIRCPRIKRTRGYPVPKDAGWRRIEGHEVELDTLWAHHVSARLIVADRIVVTKILKVAKPYVWPGAGARPVRNRIVKVDPGTGHAITQ